MSRVKGNGEKQGFPNDGFIHAGQARTDNVYVHSGPISFNLLL